MKKLIASIIVILAAGLFAALAFAATAPSFDLSGGLKPIVTMAFQIYSALVVGGIVIGGWLFLQDRTNYAALMIPIAMMVMWGVMMFAMGNFSSGNTAADSAKRQLIQ